MTSRNSLAAVAASLTVALAACRPDDGAPPPAHQDEHEHADEHHDELTLTDAAVARYGVRVEAAAMRVLVPTLTAPARVSFDTESMAHVGSTLTGRVRELRVRRGDQVKKGDVLLVLDSPELGEAQGDWLLKRTAVAVAEPSVDLAKSAHDRAKALYDESRGISLTELQRRESEWRAAAGALETAKAAATAAENRLHLLGMAQPAVEELARTGEVRPEATVRAPISGEVIDREVTLGELARPDREALLVLADMTTLWVLADVPETRLADVALGASARVVVPAFPARRFDGKVSFIGAELDAATRTARVRIEVRREGTPLRPGMFAHAQIEVTPPGGAPPAPVVAVPADAVQTVEGAPAVFVAVKDEANTFAKREVAVGPAVGGFVPILSGLAEGEPVVVAGSFVLKADLGKAGAAHEH